MASCGPSEEDSTVAPPPDAVAPPPGPIAPPLLVRARSAVLNSRRRRSRAAPPLPRSRAQGRRSSAPSCRRVPSLPPTPPLPPPTDGLGSAPWRCWSASDVARGGGLLGKRTSPSFSSGPIRTVAVYPTCPSPPKTSNHRAAPARSTNQRAAPVRSTNRRASPARSTNHSAPHTATETTASSLVIMPANQSSPWGGGGVAKQRLDSSPLVVTGGTAAAAPSPLWKAGTRTGEEANRRPLDARLSPHPQRTTDPTMHREKEALPPRPPCRAAPLLSSLQGELESCPVASPPTMHRELQLAQCPQGGTDMELQLAQCPQGGADMDFSDAVQELIRTVLLLPRPHPGHAPHTGHARASVALANRTQLANSTLPNATLVGGTLEANGQWEACESRSSEPTAASVCSLPSSPGGGAAEPGHKTASEPCLTVCDHMGATYPSVPCLTVCDHGGAPSHNVVPSMCLTNAHPRDSAPSSNMTAVALPTDSSPLAVQGGVHCAGVWVATRGADCLQASNQMSASVGSVANQISAIQLTNEPLPLCPSPPAEESAIGCQQIVEEDDEDFPDELENDCSDDDGSDCSDIIHGLSTNDVLSSMSSGLSDELEEKPALVPSLFPNTPPTLYFSTAEERVAPLPPELAQMLKWKMTTVTPNVVRNTVARSHFRATKKSHDWLGCWGHHMKSPGFKPLREYQKLNHFPGSFQIGRKDRLWRNLHKMALRYGRAEFSFFPRTFILPQDIKLLRKAWEDGGTKQKWIIKPPASARGIGIQVIHKWSQMPRKRPLLVQKYLHKPFLIGGNKFDLRIYVYVTSYDPLRIYVFSDGLVRFASVKYSCSMRTLGNKFMHLTNYSVNKKNIEYESNSDESKCQGHKWALKALWKYLSDQGVNTEVIWEKIKDIIIKTIIVSDPYVNSLVKANLSSAHSCHELFGFDILLDENLKPWLLEVNISPSLHSNTALDVRVKGPMIRDLLNLAGFRLPIKEELMTTPPCTASGSTHSVYAGRGGTGRSELSTDEKVKRAFYLTQRAEEDFLSTVLDVLTPGDVLALAESEDELSRRGAFERVFPPAARSPPSATARGPSSAPATGGRYLRFFSVPRYLNLLLDQWEARYSGCRDKGIDLLRSLCQKGVHLGTNDPLYMWSKCSYVSRFEHRPYRPTSSVVVSRWSRPRLLDSDNDDIIDDSDEEEEVPSPASSPTPSLQLTQ